MHLFGLKLFKLLTPTLAIVSLAVVHSAGVGLDAQYHIEGRVELGLDGRPIDPSRSFDFAVTVTGTQWLIRTVPRLYLEDPSSALIRYFEAGSDGTNVYYVCLPNLERDVLRSGQQTLAMLRSMEQRVSKSGGSSNTKINTFLTQRRNEILSSLTNSEHQFGPGDTANQAVGEVYPGSVPKFRDLDLIGAVWLATCSHGYFQEHKRNLLPALFLETSAAHLSSLFVTGDWLITDTVPRLPVRVAFSNAGSLFRSEEIPGARPKLTRLRAGRIHPGVDVIYEATAFKSIGSLTLPGSFEITRFATINSSASPMGAMPVAYRIRGSIENARKTNVQGSLLPNLSVKTDIGDLRFANEPYQPRPLHLARTNWPSREEAFSSTEYERARIIAKVIFDARPGHWPKYVAWIVLLCILTCPAIFYFRSRRSVERVTSNNRQQ
jgi:hypothetical protein